MNIFFRTLSARKIVPLIFVVVATVTAIVFVNGNAERRLSSSIARCEAEASKKQQCFENIIVDEAKQRGISRALDLLGELYAQDHEFATYCHGNTHQLGVLAYDKFKQGKNFSLSSKTSYCGFGFYHGFLETLLADRGDLSEARRFCEYVDNKLRATVSGVSFACYHGIGHGVVDGSDPSRWGDVNAYIKPGLALCDTLGEIEEHKARCASGVFNALAVAYTNPKYRLKANPKDPYAICRAQEKLYVRKACYDQMNGYVVATTSTFEEALKVAAESSEAQLKLTAVETVAGYTALRALANIRPLPQYLADCSALTTALRDICVRGFAVGLIEFGKPEDEYSVALNVCAQSGENEKMCLLGVTMAVHDRLSPEMQKKLCRDIAQIAGREKGEECRQTIINAPKAP